MWRSYYMTFTGEYRGASGEAHHAPAAVAHGASLDSAHRAGGDHGHGGLPHESPKTMTYVLVTLAIGCFATIALGFWAPLGHLLHLEWMQEPVLERWLAPSFAPSRALVESREAGSGTLLEWLLMFASVAVAFAGWLVARAFYKDAKSTVPQRLAAAFPGLYRLVYNKYYVDELYQATVLRPTGLLARALAVFDNVVIDGAVNGVAAVGRFFADIDGAIDKYLVDGAVNFFAEAIIRAGGRLRLLQTGRIQNYLYAAVLGALIVIGINFLIH